MKPSATKMQQIIERVMTQHWDMAACQCWICRLGRKAGCAPREQYLEHLGTGEVSGFARVSVGEDSEWGGGCRGGKGGVMLYDYIEYGLTPAQYHAGVDKLWGALGLTGVQDEDVFTLAADEIVRLRTELKHLAASEATAKSEAELEAALDDLQYRYDLAVIPPGCEKGEKWRCRKGRTAFALEEGGVMSESQKMRIKELQHRIDCLIAEVERLRREIQMHRDKNVDAYWVWQGDGTDHLESLTCPVLIGPADLAVLIVAAEAAKEGSNGN